MTRKRKRTRETSDPQDVARPPGKRTATTTGESDAVLPVARRHMRFGWWALLCFLVLGLFLESLHGFKVGWYLKASNTTRRHMWTLAHAHGTLLAVLNLVLGATLYRISQRSRGNLGLASACLLGATLLLPAGFFLGGLFTYGGDPGLGILLVPLGAVFLAVSVFLAARGWSN